MIRNYCATHVLEVCPDLVQNTSAFYDEDIGETLIERSFQIEINDIASQVREDQFTDLTSVTVMIFGFGYRDENDDYDMLMEKALCIRDTLIEPSSFAASDFITNVSPLTINSSKLPSHDSGFRIDINLEVRTSYNR